MTATEIEALSKELGLLKNYSWGKIQSNLWDTKTRFIYKTNSYKSLIEQCKTIGDNKITEYAKCRWYNFHTHNIVESMFLSYGDVQKHKNEKDKNTDFIFDGQGFDLKLTVYPKKLLGKTLGDQDLADWFYKNQSYGKRKHHKGRIFVVLLNSENPSLSWQMKREFKLIQKAIKSFMEWPAFVDHEGLKCAIIRVAK